MRILKYFKKPPENDKIMGIILLAMIGLVVTLMLVW